MGQGRRAKKQKEKGAVALTTNVQSYQRDRLGEGPEGVLVKTALERRPNLRWQAQKTALQEAAERGGKKGAKKTAGGTRIKGPAREVGGPKKGAQEGPLCLARAAAGAARAAGSARERLAARGAAPPISGNLLPAGPALQKGRIVTPSAAADCRCPAIPSHPGSAPLARPGGWK